MSQCAAVMQAMKVVELYERRRALEERRVQIGIVLASRLPLRVALLLMDLAPVWLVARWPDWWLQRKCKWTRSR